MLIDIIAFVLLLVALWKGLRKGFVVALFSLIAFIVGLAAALKLSTAAAHYLERTANISQRWLPVVAFLAVFIIVVLLIRLGAKLIEGALGILMLGWLNRLLGVLLFVFLYLFIYSVLLFYADQLHLIKPATKEASTSYGFLAPLGPKVIEGMGVILPFFKNMFHELLLFFDRSRSSAAEKTGMIYTIVRGSSYLG
jgi:membrane protein required for colicin V production